MRLLAVSLFLVTLPCLIWVRAGSHNVQRVTSLEQFKPPREGCVVNLIVESFQTCWWCYELGNELGDMLARNYVATLDFTPKSLVTKRQYYDNDFKGTCHVNWLIVNNYKGLSEIFNPVQLSKIRTKDWFVFIKADQQDDFFKCWADIIDEQFGMVFPRTVLFMMHDMYHIKKDPNALQTIKEPMCMATDYYDDGESIDVVVSTGVSCYMCPDSKSYFHFDEKTQCRNPWIALWNAGEENGYAATTEISPETTYFNGWRPTPIAFGPWEFRHTVAYIALQQLNSSFKLDTEEAYGLIFGTVWTWGDEPMKQKDDDLGIFRTVAMSKWLDNLVYCQALDNNHNKYVTALVSPFNGAIWALLVVSFFSIGLIPGVSLWMGFNIIREFIGQPPQGRKIGALVAATTILLIPVQYLYKEFFATNAMTPYEEPLLDTNQKVLEAGFKLICSYDDDEDCAYLYKQLKEKKLVLTRNAKDYIIHPKELGVGVNPDDPGILAIARDKVVEPRDARFKDDYIAEQESYYPGTKCYMVSEYWEVGLASYRFTGPLSKAMYDTLRNLRQAGIIDFWEKIPTEIKRRGMNIDAGIPASDDEADAYKSGTAYMNRTLISLIKLFAGMSGIIILCLTAEVLYPKVVASWGRWMERRRYLRAIWPLGRI